MDNFFSEQGKSVKEVCQQTDGEKQERDCVLVCRIIKRIGHQKERQSVLLLIVV